MSHVACVSNCSLAATTTSTTTTITAATTTTTTTAAAATNSRRTQQQTRNEREVTAVDLGRTNGGATADGARNGLLRQEETTGKTTASTVTWEAYRAWVLPGAARLDLSTDACRQSTRTHLTA